MELPPSALSPSALPLSLPKAFGFASNYDFEGDAVLRWVHQCSTFDSTLVTISQIYCEKIQADTRAVSAVLGLRARVHACARACACAWMRGCGVACLLHRTVVRAALPPPPPTPTHQPWGPCVPSPCARTAPAVLSHTAYLMMAHD